MYSILGFIVEIVFLIYLAIMYENEAIMLLVYLQMALFGIGYLTVLLRMFTVKGRLSIPIGISEVGKDNLVKVTVEKNGPLPMIRMKAKIVIRDTLRGERRSEWVTLPEIPRGESVLDWNTRFDSAGNYEVGLTKLRVYDWTGLLYGDVLTKSFGRIQIMPKLYDIPIELTMAVKNFYGESDVHDEHVAGPDRSELFQVRSYQPGDRLQSVHWKMTAKQDELIVKDGSLPKSCAVVVFLDVHLQKKAKRMQQAMPFVEIAASLSYSLMDAGCPHYVAWYDRETADVARVRVDDEESLFYFIGVLMGIRWQQPEEDLVQMYTEKYRQERFAWSLALDETLVLKRNHEVLKQISPDMLEKDLSEIELRL